MRLCIMSDLHLEYERWGRLSQGQPLGAKEMIGPALEKIEAADLAILAGDIDEGGAGIDYAAKLAGRLGCRVVYVPGNHEYYGHSLPSLRAELRSRADTDGVMVLDDRSINIGGWRFLGCTLWTDYRLYGDATRAMVIAGQGMDDHRLIGWVQGRLFTPEHAAGLFAASRSWLAGELAKGDPRHTVVITHHPPLPDAIAPRYRGGDLSPAFASDLRGLILAGQPALWVCGHTHYDIDLQVGRTRVVSRQRGYWGIDDIAGFEPLVMDLPWE